LFPPQWRTSSDELDGLLALAFGIDVATVGDNQDFTGDRLEEGQAGGRCP
jgi:hypothetical protein